jgi:hypothetical protein
VVERQWLDTLEEAGYVGPSGRGNRADECEAIETFLADWQDRMAPNASICVRQQQRCCSSGPIEVLCALSGFLPLVVSSSP